MAHEEDITASWLGVRRVPPMLQQIPKFLTVVHWVQVTSAYQRQHSFFDSRITATAGSALSLRTRYPRYTPCAPIAQGLFLVQPSRASRAGRTSDNTNASYLAGSSNE
jgi:hypothetical protein